MSRPADFDFGAPGLVDAGGPVVYRSWKGPPGRTIVCVHGLSGTSAHWAPVAGLARRWATVVAPDLPGFGTTPLAGRAGLAGAARAVEVVADAVDGSKPVVLLATSMGAAVAAELASNSPRMVAGLVVGSGYLPAYFGGWRAPAVVAGLLAVQAGNLGQGIVGSALRAALDVEAADAALSRADRFPGWPGVPRPSPAQRSWALVRQVAPLAARAAAPVLARRIYGRISCPVLLLHGADDPVVPVGWAHRAARDWGWELRVLPAVAHVVKLASPEWWLEEVGDWLVRHQLVDAHVVGADLDEAERREASGVVPAERPQEKLTR